MVAVCVEQYEEEKQDELQIFHGLRDTSKPSLEGVLRDYIYCSNLSVEAISELAKLTTYTWFGISKAAINYQKEISSNLPSTLQRVTEKVLHTVESGLDSSSSKIVSGITKIENVAKTPFSFIDSVLEKRGGKRGDTVRYLFEDDHTKEALLCILRLLGQLGENGKNPLKLLVGARKLAKLQASDKQLRIEERNSSLPFIEALDSGVMLECRRFINFSVAAYGYDLLNVMGLIPTGTPSGERSGILAMTGIQQEDVLLNEDGEGMYHPGHYVALSHQDKQLVIVIRGTLTIKDLLLDLVCEQVNMSFQGQTFKTHCGFLITANRLFSELSPLINETLEKHPDYSLVLTGHSLGSSISSLLALKFYEALPETDVKCFAFGSPCSACLELSQHETVKGIVTSIVLGDDFVSRLNFATVNELQKRIVALSEDHIVGEVEVRAVLEKLPKEHSDKKLYPMGRVFLLESEEFNFNALEIDPRTFCHTLEISTTFLTLHLPHMYMNALDQCSA